MTFGDVLAGYITQLFNMIVNGLLAGVAELIVGALGFGGA